SQGALVVAGSMDAASPLAFISGMLSFQPERSIAAPPVPGPAAGGGGAAGDGPPGWPPQAARAHPRTSGAAVTRRRDRNRRFGDLQRSLEDTRPTVAAVRESQRLR